VTAEVAAHETQFWELADYSPARVDNWKLYLKPRNGIAKLFDLEADPAEKNDLSETHPEMFDNPMSRYATWDRSLPPRP